MHQRLSNFRRKLGLAIGVGLGLIALAFPVSSGQWQAHEEIVAAAEALGRDNALAHGYPEVSVSVHEIDERVDLPDCEQPLQAFPAQSDQVVGPLSVGIRCAGAAPWTIYVRLDVRARRSVPVLATALASRSVVAPDDIKMVWMPAETLLNGVVLDPQDIIGMELTRTLDAGSPLRVNQLRKPKLVKRGQEVTLVSGSDGVEVRVQGKAMADGTVGDRVRVVNLGSGNRVEGVVTKNGTVRVY